MPQQCVGCMRLMPAADGGVTYPMCRICREQIKMIDGICCHQCGMPLISEIDVCLRCRDDAQPFHNNNRALYLYVGLAQRLIWAYKFSHQKRLACFFAEQIYATIPPQASKWAIVPIPGTPKNVRARGWDQIVSIAAHLKKTHHVPVLNILRHFPKRTQKKLNMSERAINAATTFGLKKKIVIPSELQSVILLDDVYTTGATVHACTQILQKAGINTIASITLAIVI